MNEVLAATVSRAEVEDLFYLEADLLDSWRLDDWMQLLTDDATYYVPPNDKPDADARYALFTIADDIVRLRERVIRLKDPNCHAEYPLSRTRRMIGNVRIAANASGHCGGQRADASDRRHPEGEAGEKHPEAPDAAAQFAAGVY